ncbi:MAG: hypothetical protein F6K23_36215 [Okeania sp. SIO2C9]|uniref:hypothetical protein n=1 Tax=Okeania sp. SIO2C9 TaxID=2607791 RepID=UPI0013BEEC3B|nr:hypothetical protein [Okeania sp. SIO2C9]NEQ77977.1 hypothetical protein [Okeania sp. SIO2C9]
MPISNSVLKSEDIEVLIQKPEDMNQDEQCPVDRQATQQEEDSMFARSLTSFLQNLSVLYLLLCLLLSHKTRA